MLLRRSKINRKTKKDVNAEKSDDKKFRRKGIFPKGISANSFEKRLYKGYPGGWGIPKCQAAAVNSPASPIVTEGARCKVKKERKKKKNKNHYILL